MFSRELFLNTEILMKEYQQGRRAGARAEGQEGPRGGRVDGVPDFNEIEVKPVPLNGFLLWGNR